MSGLSAESALIESGKSVECLSCMNRPEGSVGTELVVVMKSLENMGYAGLCGETEKNATSSEISSDTVFAKDELIDSKNSPYLYS
ncbi:hypothetical protein FACS189472_10850 [Alphaproteobacteria bacterium]|nr:hypothetical protein FACS189472_10850 [Alphaproteobacteria bacterium]